MGVLVNDLQTDFSRTRIITERAGDCAAAVDQVYRELDDRARAAFVRQQPDGTQVVLSRTADVRYVGQNHELTVDAPANRFDAAALAAVKENFSRAHREMYGYASPEKPLELVTFRVRARLAVGRHDFAGIDAPSRAGGALAAATREVYFDEAGGFAACPVYERDGLRPGDALAGPAIVEQMDATTVIPPDFGARVDDQFNLLLQPCS
jgi:N-methylhydantoinase A